MATPSENLQSIADVLQDVKLYTQATNMYVVGANGTILNVGQSLSSAIAMVVNEVSRVVSGVFAVETAISGLPSQGATDTSRMELLLQGISAKSSIAIRASNANFTSLIDAVNNSSQPQKNPGKGGSFGDQSKNDFKKIISGFGGGIAGAVSSIAIEAKNFVGSIQKAYGDGGLMGLAKATTHVVSAFAGIPGALGSVAKAVSPFVMALDPALMAKLGLALADLAAVVGYGLRPIIVMAIAAIKLFGDMLLPVMKALAPAISSISSSIMQLVIPVLKIWVDSITQLLPLVGAVGFLFRAVGETLAWASPVISLGFKTLAAGLNGIIGTIALFISVVKSMISVLLDIVANVLSKIPFMRGTADKVREASKSLDDQAGKDFNDAFKAFGQMFKDPKVEPVNPGAGAGMAAKGASFAGIGDLGKNLMQAAFGSSTERIQQQQLDPQNQANGILNAIFGALAGQGGAKMAGVRNECLTMPY